MSARLPRRLYRSRTDKMLSGVSAGLAAYFDIDPVLVRLLWVAGAVLSGGLLAVGYILLWIIVPQENYTGPSSRVVRDNVNEMAAEARRMADDVREAFRRDPAPGEPAAAPEGTASAEPAAGEPTVVEPVRTELLSPAEVDQVRRRRSMTAGVILLLIGLLFLSGNLGFFRWFSLGLYWPLILVGIGALLLWNHSRAGR